MNPLPHLSIQLFGSFTVTVNGTPVDAVRTRKDLWLLAYLAVHRGQIVSRQQVAESLWPDLGTHVALDNLRHSLWRLRRALGPAAEDVITTFSTIGLSTRACVDTVEFTRLAVSNKPNDWQAAADLWRGRPLADIDATWADSAAERLENMYRDLLARVSRHLEQDGQPGAALLYALRLAQLDPYRDDVCRQVMQLLVHAGRRREAEEYYRQFERLLADELDAQPEPATLKAAKLLRYTARPESLTTPMGSLV